MIKATSNMYLVIIFSLLFFSTQICSSEVGSEEKIKLGDVAPDFNLLDQNYKSHNLQQYKGKWLVLYFYPKDDTPGCTTQACSFRDDILKIRALKASVIGVSVDDSKSHSEFAKKYNLPFSLLADTGGRVSAIYGALSKGKTKFSKRYTFIIDPEGVIKQIYRNVNPKQHSEKVIADLKRLSQ